MGKHLKALPGPLDHRIQVLHDAISRWMLVTQHTPLYILQQHLYCIYVHTSLLPNITRAEAIAASSERQLSSFQMFHLLQLRVGGIAHLRSQMLGRIRHIAHTLPNRGSSAKLAEFGRRSYERPSTIHIPDMVPEACRSSAEVRGRFGGGRGTCCT